MSAFPPPQLQYKLALIKLQKHRSARIGWWRSSILLACASGFGLLASLPYWKIKHQAQIKINGSKLVSEKIIYDALGFAYPQFVWAIDGLKMVEKIDAIPSIAAAQVSRSILPPNVVISLQEIDPVALAISEEQVGFLDSQGEWISLDFYDNINSDHLLPKLKVVNYKTQFSQTWSKIYSLISLYPELKISEVHWNKFDGISVQSKIGRIYLGSQSTRLKQQFQIMLKLQNLPEQLDRSEIAYIDLSNSEVNLIQKY